MSLLAGAIHIKLTGDNQSLVNAVDKGKSSVKSFGEESEKSGKKSNQAFDLIKNVGVGAMLGIGTAVAAMGVAGVKSAATMQTMGLSLKTAMGGNQEATDAALKTVVDFAAKTPYALGEVQGAFVKLKNMGLDPSTEALTAYGDTASAMGKSLNDMVEAVADAATGEFERLKEFGIRSESNGNRVKLTFKGVTTEVGKNSEEIQKYLKNLGQTNFGGGMEAQSKSLAGVFSTFSDTVQLKLGEIATKSGVIDGLTNALSGVGSSIDKIDLGQVQAGMAEFGQTIQTVTGPALKYISDLIMGQVVPQLKEIWDIISPTLIPILKVLGAIIAGTVIVALVSFSTTLTALISVVKAVAVGIQTYFETLKGSIDRIFEGMKMIFSGWIKIVKAIFSGDLSGAIEGAKEIIMGLAHIDLVQVGKDMIQGLINGVGAMGGALVTAMQNMANSAMNAVKGALGIHSPSIKFFGFGENTVQGFNDGLDAKIPTLEAKLLKMSQLAMNPMKGMNNVSDSRYSGNDYSDNRVYNTINNNSEAPKTNFGWLETA
jgi:phage-related minor tail protein